ncbi:MAG TPA: hypothetical protein DDW50_17960 [Firmicutes bacterium]|jgi:hypothetical protein|nr:hypothetical protein [Bacillota bacterium]
MPDTYPPKLQLFVNRVFLERLEEDNNPELALSRGRQRAIDGWRRQGKTEEWINERIKSMDCNNSYRKILSDHEVSGNGFAICANNINCGLLGTTGKKYKEVNGYPLDANLKDCMDEPLLAAERLAELLSGKKIEKNNVLGNIPCAKVSHSVAKEIVDTVKRITN